MPIDESHPSMNTPNEDYKIWRYMDIPSFLSLLVDEALTFTSASLMEDKFEGTLPKPTELQLDSQIGKLFTDSTSSTGPKNFSEILYSLKNAVYLNCWCKAKTEMVHMWKIYSKEKGIAIETTYNKLKEAIIDEETILPTEITYLDYSHQQFDWESNTLGLFTIKRLEYQSEQELRLILAFPEQVRKRAEAETHHEPFNVFYKNFPVIKIKTDISRLIEAIHISPFAPEWYSDLAKSTLDKFGLTNISIIKSEL